MGFLVKIFGFIGSTTNTGCILWSFDEPECPKSIIEK